jgi:hypothetical protein
MLSAAIHQTQENKIRTLQSKVIYFQELYAEILKPLCKTHHMAQYYFYTSYGIATQSRNSTTTATNQAPVSEQISVIFCFSVQKGKVFSLFK